MMRTFLFLTAALWLLSPGIRPQQHESEAGTIHLKSGRSLTGTWIDIGATNVLFHDHELGPLTVSRTVIRALEHVPHEPSIFDLTPPTLAEAATLPHKTYVRYVAPRGGNEGTLATGVSRWHHPATDSTLFLVGAVHIGEPEYFQRLQQILDQTDVVLFEGVGRGKEQQEPDAGDLEKLDALMQIQLQLKDMLGLTFQKDGMDYRRPFWKNADSDYPSFRKEMDSRGVALPTDNAFVRGMMRILLSAIDPARIGSDERMRMGLRRQMASVLASPNILMRAGGSNNVMSVLIDWRNEVAIQVLDQELATDKKGRWLSLFYGAAHLPDFDQRLLDRGFVFQGLDWIDAWIIR